MTAIIQLLIGILTLIGSLALLFLMAISELNYKDLTFATYFGTFTTIASIVFFILTRNEDNEETNPGKEKPRR